MSKKTQFKVAQGVITILYLSASLGMLMPGCWKSGQLLGFCLRSNNTASCGEFLGVWGARAIAIRLIYAISALCITKVGAVLVLSEKTQALSWPGRD